MGFNFVDAPTIGQISNGFKWDGEKWVIVPAVLRSPYSVDLRDLMDNYYGVGAWTQRTADGAGTPIPGSDIGPAISVGILAARAAQSGANSINGRGTINIPAGNWQMVNPPGPNQLLGETLMGWTLRGVGSQASKVIFNGFGSCFTFAPNAANAYSGGGIDGVGIYLEAGKGVSNCGAIKLDGYNPAPVVGPPPVDDPGLCAGQMAFRDIYISTMDAGGYWYQGVQVNGASTPDEPRGSRGVTWEHMQIFKCQAFAFHGTILVQHTFLNCGAYVGYKSGAPDYIMSGMDWHILGTSAHVYATNLNTPTPAIVDVAAGDIWINGTRRAALRRRRADQET